MTQLTFEMLEMLQSYWTRFIMTYRDPYGIFPSFHIEL